jgi:hypothetical protein
MRLVLPWPPTRLQPNQRARWPERRRLAKAYLADCHAAALAGGARPSKCPPPPVRLTVTFRPPTAAPRDRDNCIGAFKHGQDAVALALGCDDAQFEVAYAPLGDPDRPHGSVVVEIAS